LSGPKDAVDHRFGVAQAVAARVAREVDAQHAVVGGRGRVGIQRRRVVGGDREAEEAALTTGGDARDLADRAHLAGCRNLLHERRVAL
jgi:hypothetical protein